MTVRNWKNISRPKNHHSPYCYLSGKAFPTGFTIYQIRQKVTVAFRKIHFRYIAPRRLGCQLGQANLFCQFFLKASGRLAAALAGGAATASCYQAADEAMKGNTNVGNCVYFRTPIEGLNGIQIGSLLYWYCDIVEYEYRPEDNSLTSLDLLADVIICPDGFVKVIDLDEPFIGHNSFSVKGGIIHIFSSLPQALVDDNRKNGTICLNIICWQMLSYAPTGL